MTASSNRFDTQDDKMTIKGAVVTYGFLVPLLLVAVILELVYLKRWASALANFCGRMRGRIKGLSGF